MTEDGQEASWKSISCPMVRGLNALAVSRFTDNPNLTARRKNSMEAATPDLRPAALSR